MSNCTRSWCVASNRSCPHTGMARRAFPRALSHRFRYTTHSKSARRTSCYRTMHTSRLTEAAHDTTERYATEFVLKLLKKRLFSSPEAFSDHAASARDNATASAPSQCSLASSQCWYPAQQDRADSTKRMTMTSRWMRPRTRLWMPSLHFFMSQLPRNASC